MNLVRGFDAAFVEHQRRGQKPKLIVAEVRTLEGFSNYLFRSDGEVMTLHSNAGNAPRVLAGGADKDGYRRFTLIDDSGARRSVRRAGLICRAFHGPPGPNQNVRHRDGNNQNDSALNLCWGTQLENIRDKELHGTQLKGETHVRAKLTEMDVREIRKSSATCATLALRYRVARCTVSAIRLRRSWKHI